MIPWERRQEIGFVTALVETTKEVLTGPSDFFRRMPVAGGIGSPLLYAVVIGYLGLLLSAVYSAVFLLVRGAVGTAALGPLSDRPELAQFVAIMEGWGGIIGQVVFEETFNGKLDKDWSWVREEPKAWRMDNHTLILRTLPGVMTAMEKSDLAFKTLLAIRAKLMEAYDEIKNISV